MFLRREKHSVSTIHRHLTEYNTNRSLMCAHRLHVDSSFLGFDAFPSAPRPSVTPTSLPDKLNRSHSSLRRKGEFVVFIFFSVHVPRVCVGSTPGGCESGARRETLISLQNLRLSVSQVPDILFLSFFFGEKKTVCSKWKATVCFFQIGRMLPLCVCWSCSHFSTKRTANWSKVDACSWSK